MWICPICHSIEYETKTDSNHVRGPGFRSWVTGYVCSGCSVKFNDPEKFNLTSCRNIRVKNYNPTLHDDSSVEHF